MEKTQKRGLFVLLAVPIGLLFVALVLRGQQSEGSSRLEGAIRTPSGQPIPRATVRVQRLAGAGPVTAYTATADDNGLFVVEGVAPGVYNVAASRPGFVGAIYGLRGWFGPGVPLTVGPGQVFTGLTMEMTRQSVIRGTITDSRGDPMQGLLVTILSDGVMLGTRRYSLAGSTLTDDSGNTVLRV